MCKLFLISSVVLLFVTLAAHWAFVATVLIGMSGTLWPRFKLHWQLLLPEFEKKTWSSFEKKNTKSDVILVHCSLLDSKIIIFFAAINNNKNKSLHGIWHICQAKLSNPFLLLWHWAVECELCLLICTPNTFWCFCFMLARAVGVIFSKNKTKYCQPVYSLKCCPVWISGSMLQEL